MSNSKRVKRDQESSVPNTSRGWAMTEPKLVESANALSAQDFYDKYAPPNFMPMLFNGLTPRFHLYWVYGDAKSFTSDGKMLRDCLHLVERTSGHDYEHAEMKWSTSKKWKEMNLPDMKYIIIVTPEDDIAGFVSFMVTYEDGYEVVYIYEIHLVPEWQGKGLGRNMTHIVEAFAQNVAVSKVMLTVFRANTRAVDWYAKLGYQEDEFSPGPRKLRNGTVKEPSYIILSKQVKGSCNCCLYLAHAFALHLRPVYLPLIAHDGEQSVPNKDCQTQTPDQCDGIEEVGIARAGVDP